MVRKFGLIFRPYQSDAGQQNPVSYRKKHVYFKLGLIYS